MTARRVRRYVDDLLRGRRPRPFRADDAEAAEIRTAITLTAGGPDHGAPREEFVNELHQRLASELEPSRRLDEPAPGHPYAPPRLPSRRRLVQVGSVAAAAVAAGAAGGALVERALSEAATVAADGTLTPDHGTWQTVAASAELADGAVRPFEVGSVQGFVERTAGRLRAVSGICTHQGCALAFDRPAGELVCPCHATAFALDGALVRHQLASPPPALPRLAVREVEGLVQIFAP